MEHDFYCRVRRYYRDIHNEIWSIEFDYGDGYVAEDKVILEWDNKDIKVLWLIQSSDRMESEEYTSIILALFEDIIDDEGDFQLVREYEINVMEYDVEELKNKHSLVFHKTN